MLHLSSQLENQNHMMLKSKVLQVSIAPLVLMFIVNFFSTFFSDATSTVFETIRTVDDSLYYEYPGLSNLAYQPAVQRKDNILFFDKDFLGFKEALAFKESQGRYYVVNKYGYMGKYQFGKGTLAMVGVYDTKEFLRSPSLQEKAFIANLSRNKWVLRKYISYYVGKKVGGVLVTESGILAAAHLAGPKSVKSFLSSNGTKVFKDGFGTSIVEYMTKFKSFDISDVPENRKAKATHKNLI